MNPLLVGPLDRFVARGAACAGRGVLPPVSYGVNLQALCVLLLVVHAVPIHRCVQLIAAITGATPSPGFVHSMLKCAYTALSDVDARIRTLLILAYAVCCDETPLRVGPKKMRKYLLVACTELYT